MDTGVIQKKQFLRRVAVGAEVQEDGTHFRVWAPACREVAVTLESGAQGIYPLTREEDGYWSAVIPAARARTLYRFRLDNGDLFPDPASRYQPQGPHGPSEVIDPARYPWTDRQWAGIAPDAHVLYEIHVGTFTPEGTWRAAAEHLKYLQGLGVTTIQMMPVAEFPGRFGWGYDGVNLFAPARLYGRPDDLRHFINCAHETGLAVILDVVYNHLGPDGNYLSAFTADYFSHVPTEWGPGFNFDCPNSRNVRDFITANAAYWIGEFHFDGLRLDATQQIFDTSEPHIITEIAAAARQACPERHVMIIAENEPQDPRLIRPIDEGGFGLDAAYNDDFHHTAIVAASGRHEAYYSDYRGTPQEFISLAKRGYLYQGQFYEWQHQRRGRPALDRPHRQFIIGIENHDQIANSGHGMRVHKMTSPGRLRAMTAVMLLMPQIPMLFQGQEFAASTGFHYFADHAGDLAKAVHLGRAAFMSQFPSMETVEMQAALLRPEDPEAFMKSRLDHRERDKNTEILHMHRDLLTLRREDPLFRHARELDGAVLSAEAFVIRFMGEDGDDRLLLVNMGQDLDLHPSPEPLLAPPEEAAWTLLWSSESPQYGGGGTPAPEASEGWHLPGHAALVMKAQKP
ncbi:MAG: malto-oligosyltrehalose trehalohydrolase [Alphaproteobacteria bacterium]